MAALPDTLSSTAVGPRSKARTCGSVNATLAARCRRDITDPGTIARRLRVARRRRAHMPTSRDGPAATEGLLAIERARSSGCDPGTHAVKGRKRGWTDSWTTASARESSPRRCVAPMHADLSLLNVDASVPPVAGWRSKANRFGTVPASMDGVLAWSEAVPPRPLRASIFLFAGGVMARRGSTRPRHETLPSRGVSS